jgi:NADPH oxidase
LVAQTNYGRPNWPKEFSRIKENHKGKDIGVFFCGPEPLSQILNRNCNDFSDHETTFLYGKENF